MAALLFVLLPLFLSAASADPQPNATLISDACRHTTVHYSLCVTTLSSHPKVKSATGVRGLVFVAIEATTAAAVNTSTYVDGLLDKGNDTAEGPAFQQCLADCGEQYVDAVEQLDDAAVALESKADGDVIRFVEAAVADIKTCQAGCKAVEEHENVLTKPNGDFERLASIVLRLTKILPQ